MSQNSKGKSLINIELQTCTKYQSSDINSDDIF